MSVINQMLNDLQQREQQKQQGQQLPGATSSPQAVLAHSPSGTRNLILAVFLTVITCSAVFFIWQLNQENQALKQTLARQEPPASQEPSASQEPAANEALKVKAEPSASHEPSVRQEPSARQEPSVRQEPSASQEPSAGKTSGEAKQTAKTSEATQTNQPAKNITKPLAIPDITPPLTLPVTATEQPRLAISRKQVSAAELVEQKTAQVEQAINRKQLLAAEELLEDILILQPENGQSRKQLAALWFGRQAYQAAINVLAQGVNLAPENSEFRLMQAKIYLAQGQKEKAYQALQMLATTDNNDYQGALANLAQQTGRYQQASDIYQTLTRSQPGQSRWWLGLAVAYDSNAEFDLAVIAYRDALEKGNLSMSSIQFARQRLQQLGG